MSECPALGFIAEVQGKISIFVLTQRTSAPGINPPASAICVLIDSSGLLAAPTHFLIFSISEIDILPAVKRLSQNSGSHAPAWEPIPISRCRVPFSGEVCIPTQSVGVAKLCGNDLTPIIPSFIPIIPSFIPVIPSFIPVIPAKAGIQTDSPPEPYCPVPSWPCHPREGRDPPLALDSRLRGNDDLRAWERAVGVLRHPQSVRTSCTCIPHSTTSFLFL